MKSPQRLRDIAELVGGRLSGDGECKVSRFASLEKALPGDLTYLESPKLLKELASTRASGVIVDEDVAVPAGLNVIRVRQPSVAWAKALAALCPYERLFHEVSPHAHLGTGVELGAGVGIGPGAWIGDGASIGARTEIYPGVTVGPGVAIGEDCRLYPGVHIYRDCRLGRRVIVHGGAVIGADGYGYVQEETADPAEPVVHRKVPQIGTVVIEDDVEIGANTTIDRAALEATVIGLGTKIDNLVMVGHNCRTGRHCLLIAQVGLAGTIELGDYVTIAGQAGLAGHLKVGDRATIGAQTGIMSDVEPGQVMIGSPALPAGLARRAYAQIEHLPEFRRQLQEIRKRLAELEEKIAAGG
jgi:UDP-3-O-[3-hydroxymyristoyl] glucosamine N-acyltransferase